MAYITAGDGPGFPELLRGHPRHRSDRQVLDAWGHRPGRAGRRPRLL